MKTAQYRALLAIITITLVSCGGATDNKASQSETTIPPAGKIESAGWLIGSWKSNTPDGVAYEVWVKESGSAYAGKSFFVKGSDTIPQETVKLEQKGNDLLYIPTVNGQNDGKPVIFTSTNVTDSEMVFENQAHDFPQKISYKRIGADSLLAVVSGNVSGKMHSESFPMGRVR